MATDSPTDDVCALYDASADSYAKMMDAEIDQPVYHAILSKLAERIAGVPGPVVDTSCGSGHMLSKYHERYDPKRELIGIDLSPRMVSIASGKLGSAAEVRVGDMRAPDGIASNGAAAVLSYFAVHHLRPTEVAPTLREWKRILGPGGRLVLATWEGVGRVDYGDHSDVVAHRYTRDQVMGWIEDAGLIVVTCTVQEVEGMGMGAIYLDAHAP